MVPLSFSEVLNALALYTRVEKENLKNITASFFKKTPLAKIEFLGSPHGGKSFRKQGHIQSLSTFSHLSSRNFESSSLPSSVITHTYRYINY